MAVLGVIAFCSSAFWEPPGALDHLPFAKLLRTPWELLDEMVEAMTDPDFRPPETLFVQPAAVQNQRRYAEPYPWNGLEAVADDIRTEVNRNGRLLLIDSSMQAAATHPYPLPFVGSWAKGHNVVNLPQARTVAGIPPLYQYQLLQQGRRLLPWFGAPAPNLFGVAGEDELWSLNGEQQFLQTCSALELPVSFIQGGQWEQLFDPDPRFSGRNYVANNYHRPAENGGLGAISPAGTSNAPWNALGVRAASDTLSLGGGGALSQLGDAERLYPNQSGRPQRIFFLSNDEMRRVRWSDVPEYSGMTPSTARDVWGRRFNTVYNSMFDSFSGRLPPAWRPGVSFVSYKAFGFDGWSRFGEWWRSSHHSASFGSNPFPSFWDGSAVQTLPLPGAVDQLVSPFADAMNFAFMADQALSAKPFYWNEITIRNDDDSVSAARWGAFCRHQIWLLRPRVVRVWENSSKVLVDDVAMQARLQWTLDEVDSIWNEPTLRRFWQWGRLLTTDDADGGKGPFQVDVPPAWEVRRRPRWFRLAVDRYGDASTAGYPFSDAKTRTTLQPLIVANPGRTKHYNQIVDVWSLAFVNGSRGNREWLVYLFSSSDVLDFGNVILSVPDDLSPNKRLKFKSLFAHRLGKFFYFQEGADGQPIPRGEVRLPPGRPLPGFARIVKP